MLEQQFETLSSRVAGVIFAAALASSWLGSAAIAQDEQAAEKIGSVVSVSGGGGEVRAFGARVSVDGVTARVKAAGAIVDIRGEVDGHVWAAGADVTIAGQVGGGVRAAGGHAAVRGRIAGDVSVAGALVDVDVATEGNVRAAGASVSVGPLTDIDGTLSAAGASVGFDGHVVGEAKFAGAIVTLNGRADGDVSVYAERLILGPRAVIGGNLMVRSLDEPQVDPAATVSGEILHEGPGAWFDELPRVSAPILAAAIALSIFLSGLFFLIFARSSFGEAVDHVRFRPISTALYGIVALFCISVVAAFLMTTIVGFALGVALLLLLPIVFVLSHPVAAAGIVGWIVGRNVPRLGIGRLVLFLIVGALVVSFAGIIPFTGPWIVIVMFIFGVGGVLRATLWRFRTMRASDQTFGSNAAAGEVGQQ